MSYANDFPTSWPGCNLIVDFPSGVPIKNGVVKKISAITPVGKSKEKKIKKETGKKSKVKKSVEGTRLAKVSKRERLLQLASNLLFFRTLGKWTLRCWKEGQPSSHPKDQSENQGRILYLLDPFGFP